MSILTVRKTLRLALPLLSASLVMACGGSDTSTVDGGKGSGATGNGSGGSISLGTGGNGTLPGMGSGGVTTISRDAACADGSGVGDAIPAIVQMVIDISGSMNWAPGTMRNPGRGQQSKWDITSTALKGAVASLPASIGVGLNFYPNNPPGTRRGAMPTPEDCITNRVDLPIALLGANNSAQRRAFNTAIDGVNPSDGTPTHAAYKFGSETVAATKLAGRKFVLLITDGIPTYPLDCSGDGMGAIDSQPLIDEVAKSFAAGISTFVIGSPGSEDARNALSQMASKGGTAKAGCSDDGPNYCHLDMTTAADFGAALSAGLADVAGQIGTCEFTVPPSPAGKMLDPGLVNVLYTHADGTESSIPQDAAGTCKSGWQYDDPMAPTKITLCGSDCDAVKADGGAKIDVIFGCTTETNVPVK
jgi:hypothetical protein